LSIYALAARALSPLAPALLRARAQAGKEDASRLGERLGRASLARPEGRLAWLHGASVGESLSLLALADRLRAERPAVTVLVTSGTRAAAELLAERLPAGALHQYAPVDTPGAVARFLGHWRADLVVIAESELWPNLILGAKARGARLALVSARLSPASLRRWRRAPRAAGALFGAFDLVLARDRDAADGLRALGARVDGVADMKLAAQPLPVDEGELARLRAAIGGRPVILAASTHDGEETLILERFAQITKDERFKPLLIVAPRHVDRGVEIERLATGLGFAAPRRSAGADWLGAAEVYVADTVGELGLWYRLAGLAVLGGSLVPGVGGHNPLEPARLGCAFVVGPHTENWPLYGALEAEGASARVAAPGELDRYFRDLLEAPAALAAMAGKARAHVAALDAEARETTARVLALIGP